MFSEFNQYQTLSVQSVSVSHCIENAQSMCYLKIKIFLKDKKFSPLIQFSCFSIYPLISSCLEVWKVFFIDYFK